MSEPVLYNSLPLIKDSLPAIATDPCDCCISDDCPTIGCDPMPGSVVVTLGGITAIPNANYRPGTGVQYRPVTSIPFLDFNGDYELPCTGNGAYGDQFTIGSLVYGTHAIDILMGLGLTFNATTANVNASFTFASVGSCTSSDPATAPGPPLFDSSMNILAGWPTNVVNSQLARGAGCSGSITEVVTGGITYGTGISEHRRTYSSGNCREGIVGSYARVASVPNEWIVFRVPELDGSCNGVTSLTTWSQAMDCTQFGLVIGTIGGIEPFNNFTPNIKYLGARTSSVTIGVAIP